ncbi:hypothetical protein CLHOM_34780 [Clostridium homopropionicum DSM 5847]|uniref:Uncharacterized protein n=2 Tax=Clostridium TaxID=1485 RepID=A0A0L6Z6J1_9CLOT|nr:hypothetical protein CLHOM_34780 [Clostridium homopropionicum DSM 5847]
MEVTKEGIVLKEINPQYTIEQVQALTEAELIIAEKLETMKI